MTGRSTMPSARVALCVIAVAMLQACGEDGSFTLPPSYHDVVVTASGLRTGYRTVDDPQWYFHADDDAPEGNCWDLAVSPNGALRYLSYVERVETDSWRLLVRAGLGNAEWESTYSTISVPAPEVGGFSCAPTRIEHLTGDLYGIFWLTEGEMHSAVFDSSKPAGSELVLSEPFAHASFSVNENFEQISARRLSAVYFNDEVRVIWSPLDRDRINMVAGEIGENGIEFDTASTFTPHQHVDMSDALAHEGSLYVATTDGETLRLWSRSGTVQWTEAASCDRDPARSERLPGRLLYADEAGAIRALIKSRDSFNGALINFADCSGTSFPLPVVAGVISYFPGTAPQ